MCLFPSLHTCQLSDSHQIFPNSKDAQAKYIILMDGFINSRALEPLNSALKSFTMVCNLLIGIYESSLRGKCKKPTQLEAQSWVLLLVRRRVPCLSFPLKAPCLPVLGSNASTGWQVATRGHPHQTSAPGLDTCHGWVMVLATARLVHLHC